MAESLRALLRDVRSCQLCTRDLPHGARPILQLDRGARILIASQAPGRRAHESGVPFRDASGERLRQWMRVAPDVFYDASRIAILPMGLCYPGTGPSGDLPPRPECSDTWRRRLLAQLPQLELTLVIGQYAQAYHLPRGPRRRLTDTVRAWREGWPAILPLPHPSPRNNPWLRSNPWFEREVLPALRQRLRGILGTPGRRAPSGGEDVAPR